MSQYVAPSAGLAVDVKSLSKLKLQAGQNDPAAVKEAAKQFEALFMQELIKSMRSATLKSGMLDSPQGDLTSDMLDQQLAVQMSGQPGGLSEAIVRQLTSQMARSNPTSAGGTGTSTGAGAALGAANGTPAASPASAKPVGPALGNPKATKSSADASGFVQKLNTLASKVEKSSGIPAAFMIGQAAHETGWGKHEIRMPDGSPSFNLFGIKAGANWTGKVAEVATTEYINGQPQRVVQRFRAYDSYEASLQDYARLINKSPRYAQARQQTSSPVAYATSLQRAGYATDPAYAAKLSQAINSTLRLQRAQA